MALPPHIIKKRIDAMPDGPEKEKKLKRFHRDITICTWGYAIMLLIMLGMTLAVIITLVVSL